MDSFKETHAWQREKAVKALKIAKEHEASKLATGAKYIQQDHKTWKLKRGQS